MGFSILSKIGFLGGLAVTGAQVDTGTSPNTLSASSVASYKAGVEADYDFMPALLGLEVDLLYASYQWDLSVLNTNPATSFNSKWWELPLFVNYTGIPMFKFGFGPIFDFATGAGVPGLGRTSVGLGFQSGYSYTFQSPWSVDADIRYVLGLTNLAQTSPMTTKIHSFDFLVGVGYAF
jgi:hypothetical protein